MPSTLEDRVRDDLGHALGAGPEPIAAWADVEPVARAAHRRRQRRRGALATLAMGVVIAAVVAGVAFARSDRQRVDTGPVDGGRPTPTTAVPPKPTATVDLGAADVSDLVAGPDGAWLGLVKAHEVVHVDAAGHVVARVAIPGSGGYPIYLAEGEGAVWAIPYGGPVYRIDPVAGRVSGSVSVPSHGATGPARGGPAEAERVAAGEGQVWVTACCDAGAPAPNQRLVRINPRTLAIEGETSMPGQGESQDVVVGPQGVFVTGEGFDTIVQVDASDGHIVRQIPVGGPSASVALGPRDIWATVPPADPYGHQSGELLHIGAGGVVARIALPSPGEQVAAAGVADAWVLTFAGDVLHRGVGNASPSGSVVHAGAQFIASSDDALWYVSGSTLVERPG